MEIKKIENGNFVGKILHDEDANSPREWDNLGTLIARGNYSHLGDKHGIDFSSCNSWDDEEKLIRRKFGRDCIMIPVYGYSHGGLTLSTTPFSCPWDSGRFGTIVVSCKDARENWGMKRLTKEKREHSIQILKQEVNTMTQYVEGDVYGYQIVEIMVDDDGDTYEEDRDSCWGFYGMEHIEAEVKHMLEHYVERQAEAMVS